MISLILFVSQVPTLGSQEGAFENVKMTFSGEQGQAIRQLIGAHVLRRVAMCCLASPRGRRQHLAVSHEKGKVSSACHRNAAKSRECQTSKKNAHILGNHRNTMKLE